LDLTALHLIKFLVDLPELAIRVLTFQILNFFDVDLLNGDTTVGAVSDRRFPSEIGSSAFAIRLFIIVFIPRLRGAP
jgi:hypothetical protein